MAFLIISLMLVIAVWILGPKIVNRLQTFWMSDLNGPLHPTLGDTYSAISALFSGLAFAAVFWTLYQHQKQINQSQIREHIFQLINSWQSAVSNIQYKDEQGYVALVAAENDFLGVYDGRICNFVHTGLLNDIRRDSAFISVDEVQTKFKEFYEKDIGGCLAHIFRIQYQVLKTIDTSKLPKDSFRSHFCANSKLYVLRDIRLLRSGSILNTLPIG